MHSEQHAQYFYRTLHSALRQWFWTVLPHHVRHMISLMPGLLTMCSVLGQTQQLHDEAAGERTTDWQLTAVQKEQTSRVIIAATSKQACSS